MPDTSITAYCIIFAVGLFAGVVNTLAGGGSLLTLPVMIFLGLPASVANGTNRIAIWIQCVSAVWGFKQKGISNFKTCLWLSIPAVIGAIAGAQFSVEIPDAWFQTILAIVILLVVGLIVWKPRVKPDASANYAINYWLASPVFLAIGFYGGFIQAGVGYLLMAAFATICRFDLVTTAAAKVFTVAVYTTFAVLVFIVNDEINWWFALYLSLGNGIGGYLGTALAHKHGETLIRWILIITASIMALKLLGILPSFN